MAKKNHREATPALTALTRGGIAFTRHTYEHDPRSTSYGAEAAESLGVDAHRVLKTLVVDADGELCVAVVAASRSLDLKAVARVLKAKSVTMADARRAQRATGQVVGAISPIAQRSRLRTVVDATAGQHTTVFVSAGRRGLEVELSPHDLIAMTAADVGPIGR